MPQPLSLLFLPPDDPDKREHAAGAVPVAHRMFRRRYAVAARARQSLARLLPPG